MDFEWDPDKAAKNLAKHRVSFQEAATVFADPLSMTYDDPDHSVVEQRYITVGVFRRGRVLIVAHTDRGKNVRLISARKAARHEKDHYEESHP